MSNLILPQSCKRQKWFTFSGTLYPDEVARFIQEILRLEGHIVSVNCDNDRLSRLSTTIVYRCSEEVSIEVKC